MVKWYTRHQDNTGATTTYSGLTLDAANNTVTSPKIADGYGYIKYIVVSTGLDAATTADVGNILVLKLSGDAMYHGDQEIIVGTINAQETGASVTEQVIGKNAFVLDTNIWLKPGQTLDLNGAYYGTDVGTPMISASIGVERGRGGIPRQYRTRAASDTSATDVYVALQTRPDGSTGGFDAPRGVISLNRMLTAQVLNANAATLIGMDTFFYQLTGDALGSTSQEIVGGTLGFDEGGGAITATDNLIMNPSVIPVEVPLVGGNSFTINALYKGADTGTQFIGVTTELLGGIGVEQ